MPQHQPKAAQRRSGLSARRSLSVEERTAGSLAIADAATNLPAYRRAKRIAIYLPLKEEVSTWPIAERAWRMGKRVFAPAMRAGGKIAFLEFEPQTQLRENAFAIPEPIASSEIDAKQLDVAFTPVVAFDDRCERIGWGGGYYDRSFAFANLRQSYAKPKLIGLAFACQQVERIASETRDVPLYQVVTEHMLFSRQRSTAH